MRVQVGRKGRLHFGKVEAVDETPGPATPIVSGCGAGRRCGNDPSTESHPCPFRSDVYDDSAVECNCCTDCVNECAMDI